jgi:RNA polymerase sigma-70 factor (ECF subfamily)
MSSDDSTRTSGTLLRRAADWRDSDAWQQFFRQYDPYLQSWCREYRLDHDVAGDVVQLFWLELAGKMRSFSYDPSRRFRGWLRTCFHWRVVDAIRERNRQDQPARSIDDHGCADFDASHLAFLPAPFSEDDHGTDAQRPLLLELAEEVQAAVRERVHLRSWQAFWHIAIDGWTTRQTAEALNMSYLAAHAAHRRVAERLAEEGSRRLGERMCAITNVGPE